MKSREELSKRFTGQLASDLINGGNPASNRITWLVLAMLAFVGEEAVQILFRKDFGKGALDRRRIVGCFLLFEIIAMVFLLLDVHTIESMEVVGSRSSFTWAGVFYGILGLIVLIKGFREWEKAKTSDSPDKFPGESTILSFLGKDGWSQSKIQNVAEPIFTLALGIGLGFVNILWGIPVVYCAISVWVCKVIEAVFFEPSAPQPASQQQGRSFHDIK